MSEPKASVFTARFLIEFVKERQATYEQNLPLSVGQLLSIPFVLAGLILIWRALAHAKASECTTLNRAVPRP